MESARFSSVEDLHLEGISSQEYVGQIRIHPAVCLIDKVSSETDRV